ncbi:hypothetical protein [Streptomyces sp. NPDC008139]|uniref:hypothetical protein n=1 Tax=Streptomyces sp. NPDC008139 TaxID=3364814 RepID=UPI0036EEE667
MSAYREYVEAAERITRDSIAEFCAETGLTHLGDQGQVYLLGPIRVRGTFADVTGRPWADGNLVAESMTSGTGRDREECDYWAERVCGGIEGHGLWIANPERGLHDATVCPLVVISAQLDLPAPQPFPDGWARSWADFPSVSDERELGMVAAGYPGTAKWRRGEH